MAKNLELREKIDGYFNNTDSLIYLRSHWDHLDGKPADYTPAPHDATHKAYNDALYLGKLAKAADSSLLDGNTLAEVRAGVTASDVGLENVDNVADVNKYVAGVKETRASVNTRFWTGTLSEYNAIGTKSSNTIYFVTA